MTTRRTHNCNLCHANVFDGNGVGLTWGAQNAIKLTTPGQAETHVCQACITALETALEDQREMMRKRDEAASCEPPADALA